MSNEPGLLETISSELVYSEPQNSRPSLKPLQLKKIITKLKHVPDIPLLFTGRFNSAKTFLSKQHPIIKDAENPPNSAFELRKIINHEENPENSAEIFSISNESPKNLHELGASKNKTPSFSATHTEEIKELKEMFKKLKTDQEKLKNQLSSHNSLLKMLGSNVTPPKNSDSEFRIRSFLKKNTQFPDSQMLLSPRKINFTKIPQEKLNISHISPRLQDTSINLPSLFSTSSDRKIRSTKGTPLKYFRDQPILSKNQKFPKDIFTVKKKII